MKYVSSTLVKIAFAGLVANAPVATALCDVAQMEGSEIRADQWQGFWLGQSIATWTGMITEMDKIEGDEAWSLLPVGGAGRINLQSGVKRRARFRAT